MEMRSFGYLILGFWIMKDTRQLRLVLYSFGTDLLTRSFQMSIDNIQFGDKLSLF